MNRQQVTNLLANHIFNIQMWAVCPVCKGIGHVSAEHCPECNGKGNLVEKSAALRGILEDAQRLLNVLGGPVPPEQPITPKSFDLAVARECAKAIILLLNQPELNSGIWREVFTRHLKVLDALPQAMAGGKGPAPFAQDK